jgi:hypothetical protein
MNATTAYQESTTIPKGLSRTIFDPAQNPRSLSLNPNATPFFPQVKQYNVQTSIDIIDDKHRSEPRFKRSTESTIDSRALHHINRDFTPIDGHVPLPSSRLIARRVDVKRLCELTIHIGKQLKFDVNSNDPLMRMSIGDIIGAVILICEYFPKIYSFGYTEFDIAFKVIIDITASDVSPVVHLGLHYAYINGIPVKHTVSSNQSNRIKHTNAHTDVLVPFTDFMLNVFMRRLNVVIPQFLLMCDDSLLFLNTGMHFSYEPDVDQQYILYQDKIQGPLNAQATQSINKYMNEYIEINTRRNYSKFRFANKLKEYLERFFTYNAPTDGSPISTFTPRDPEVPFIIKLYSMQHKRFSREDQYMYVYTLLRILVNYFMIADTCVDRTVRRYPEICAIIADMKSAEIIKCYLYSQYYMSMDAISPNFSALPNIQRSLLLRTNKFTSYSMCSFSEYTDDGIDDLFVSNLMTVFTFIMSGKYFYCHHITDIYKDNSPSFKLLSSVADVFAIEILREFDSAKASIP